MEMKKFNLVFDNPHTKQRQTLNTNSLALACMTAFMYGAVSSEFDSIGSADAFHSRIKYLEEKS